MASRTASDKRRPARAPRAYRQARRAEQMQANGGRILDAAIGLIKAARRTSQITLDDIARQSGLTVRTLLRRFGSRDGVLEAAFARLRTEIEGLRTPTPPGDVDGAVRSLVDHYEQIGDFNIRSLEEEDQFRLLHQMLGTGRAYHREWLRRTFGPLLAALPPDEQERRIIALYAATDVYLWKLLRRDLGFGRDQTQDTYARLVRGVLTSTDDHT